MLQVTGGQYKGRKIKVPLCARPTLSKVRESLFNVLASYIEFNDKRFLDLFSGSGIIGIEALSRGFSKVLEVENDKNALNYLKVNYKTLGLELDYKFGDAASVLKKLQRPFDVIFCDPPYENIEKYQETARIIKEKGLIEEGGILIYEHNPRNEFRIEGYELDKIKIYGLCALSFFLVKDA